MTKEKKEVLNLVIDLNDFLDILDTIIDCMEVLSNQDELDIESDEFKFLMDFVTYYTLGKAAYSDIGLEFELSSDSEEDYKEDYIKYNKDKHLLN